VADRLVTNLVSPTSQTAALAQQSRVHALEAGYMAVDKVIEYVMDRPRPMIARFRERNDATE
jgi:DNA-binding ferritin-like protein